MFSGIIEHLGHVVSVEDRPDIREIVVETGFADLEPGESVAVNGVCLTVTLDDEAARAKGRVHFILSRETLDRTGLHALKTGARVNLERAVSLSTRLSGHIVQGHVDGVAHLEALGTQGESHLLTLRVPEHLRRYMVEKGSIALDGISLTLNRVSDPVDGSFDIDITIVPHTWTHTILSDRTPGDAINVEVDIVAKYVESMTRFARVPS